MNVENSILVDIRESVGLDPTNSSFDKELLQHINVAIGKLNQNGIGNPIVVSSDETKWSDLKNADQVEGNVYFASVPLFITLSTKLLFDPPPPSVVEYHHNNANEILWRLKVAYETYEQGGV